MENTNLLLQVRTRESKILIFDFRWVSVTDDDNDDLFYAGKDVSEYIASEEKYFITEQKFRRMVDNFPFGSMIVIEGKIDFINSRGLEILGAREQNEVMGKEAILFFKEESREKICGYRKNIFENRSQVVSFEEQLVREDGRLIDAEIKLLPFNYYENSAYQITFTDITERNQSESEKQIFTYAIEQSPGSVLITDTDGIIEYANPKYYEITGYEEKDIIGKNANILNAGFHSKEFYEQLWSTIKGGRQWSGTFCNKKKNGEYFWESALISGVKNLKGEITHFVAVKDDITNRIKASKALERSEQLFRSIYENTSVGIFRLTSEFDLTIVNPAVLKIFECNNIEEMKNIYSALRNDKSSWLSGLENRLIKDGEVNDFHVSFLNKKNKIIYLKINCKSINKTSEETDAYEGILEDITVLKRAEGALIEAKEKAERSNKLKSDFLAQISHEIRTPMNAILSFSTLLKNELQEKVNDDLKEGFDIIENGSRRLIRTIDLILNMSQIQTGNYDLSYHKINILKDVLNPLIKDFEIFAKNKKLELNIDRNFKDDCNVIGDQYTITQLFANLIDNAIKYTDRGKVEVKLSKNKKDVLRVDVLDTGIGISSDYLPKAFEPFSQEETGYTRRFEGTGLGLSLVKKYCEINGAEIEVKSIKEQGSIFSISFKQSI